MFWNNGGTFCNLLTEALGSAFSLFEEQEQALLAYCHFHSFLIFPKTLHCPWKQCTRRFGITGYSVHHKIRSQVQTNHALYSCVTGCIKFTKRVEFWIDFPHLNDIFKHPGQNELIVWKMDSPFFFSCLSFLRLHTPNCNKVVIEKSKKQKAKS